MVDKAFSRYALFFKVRLSMGIFGLQTLPKFIDCFQGCESVSVRIAFTNQNCSLEIISPVFLDFFSFFPGSSLEGTLHCIYLLVFNMNELLNCIAV